MSFSLDRRKACPVTRYAKRVIDGKEPAGRLVRLACQRHIDDLKNAKAKGFYFERESSERAIFFVECLRHTKGEWGGLRIELSDWQKFIIGSIFGWKWKETGLRRFATAYDEVARKNGKSTLCGGTALLFMAADGEPGAEVYTVATKRDQARIVFNESRNMIKALPGHYELRKIVSVYQHMLMVERSASKMEPLSSDAKTMDGLNPHAAIIDELHAHESRAVLDVIDTALGARRQPFKFIITTAGFNQHGPCYEERDYAIKVLEGIVEDETLFVYIATIDEGDDPMDEKVWVKANPNIGIAPKVDYLRKQARKAKEMPSFYNEFLTKHLNVWTQTEVRWLSTEQWDQCDGPVNLEKLKTRPCWGGLDLSSTTDISAFAKVWPPYEGDPRWYVDMRFWLPGANILERGLRDKAPYERWAREGLITLTDGNVIDHSAIEAAVLDDWSSFDIRDIGVDPHNATMLTTRLMDQGVEMVDFRQGFLSMSPAVKQAETVILGGKLRHGGNAALRWMAHNVVMKMDEAGNIKPDKRKSTQRIDGIVAMIMGIGRACAAQGEGPSVYSTRGIIEL